jgi:hypothetical protein
VYRLAVGSGTEGLARKIAVHVARERVGHDERRRREVSRAPCVDAPFEVADSLERTAARDQALVVDRFRSRARGPELPMHVASVAHDVEAKLGEVRQQARAFQVARHDLRSRREARLDPRRDRESRENGLLREQAGADHHRGIGSIGTARDRGDHDRTVTERERAPVAPHLDLRVAIDLSGGGEDLVPRFLEAGCDLRERDAVLRSLRAGETRLDRREIELERFSVRGLGRARLDEETLLAQVRLDEPHALLGATRET